MKKLLIPAFACAAMFTACGDDSSSANDAAESSSSVAAESSSSVVAESSSSDWAHEGVGGYLCLSDKDSTTILGYAFEGPDSAMEVASFANPKILELYEDVEKVCEEAKANKTDEQEVTCGDYVEISYQPKTMTFESLKTLMEKECKAGSIMNDIDMTDPDVAPENKSGFYPRYYETFCIEEYNQEACSKLCRSYPGHPACDVVKLVELCKQNPDFSGCPNNTPSY